MQKQNLIAGCALSILIIVCLVSAGCTNFTPNPPLSSSHQSISDNNLPNDKLKENYSIFISAPLFSEGECQFNKELALKLSDINYDVYLPQEFNIDLGTGKYTREEIIYRTDLDALKKADIVVGVIDGSDADSGTSWEMGYATALGKPIFALRTDFRKISDNEAVNLMLETDAEVCFSVDELINKLIQFKDKKENKKT